VALIIPPDVLRQLEKVPKADQARVLESLEQVAADPSRRLPFVTRMVGEPDVWRLRKGDWRAVFRVHGTDIVLDRVGHRRDIYR
jgi:mRNA-degrading endonuclease RelE of RelBE toxin-antitoxin system